MAESEAALKWRGLIAEQAKGGKSVVEFCRERGESREGFFRWRKRLKAKEEPRGAGFIEVRAAEEGTMTIPCQRSTNSCPTAGKNFARRGLKLPEHNFAVQMGWHDA